MATVVPYKIILADDHILFRQLLKRTIEQNFDLQIIGEARDGQELLNLFSQLSSKPNLVILDISMPKLSGIEAARRIKKIDPGVKILILTIHKEKEYLNQAISAGAEGYLLKEEVENNLFSAIQAIQRGSSYSSAFFSGK